MSDSMSEEWRPIAGYEGSYEVSNQGNVRSLKRGVPRFMKLTVAANGYPVVNLTDWEPGRKARQKVANVHALVAEAFLGPRPDGLEICHGNGDKQDNRLANLRYDTGRANSADKYLHGTVPLGEAHHNSRLTSDQVHTIRALRKQGLQIREIATLFGVGTPGVGAILRGQTWGWLD